MDIHLRKVMIILTLILIMMNIGFGTRKEGKSKYNEMYKQYWSEDKFKDKPEYKQQFEILKSLRNQLKGLGYKTAVEDYKNKIEQKKQIYKKTGKSEQEIKKMINEELIFGESEILNKENEIIDAKKAEPNKKILSINKGNINVGKLNPDIMNKVIKKASGYFRSELTKDGDFRFYYMDDEGNEAFTVFEPGNKINAIVYGKILKEVDYFTYNYIINNLKTSSQSIIIFAIDYGNFGNIKEFYYNKEYVFISKKVITNNVFCWLLYNKIAIHPLDTSDKIYIKSSDKPGIINYYLGGNGQDPDSHAPYMRQDILVNSVSGKTLGPVKLPWEDTNYAAPNKTTAMIDRLTGYMGESYDEGWIEDINVRDDLTNRLAEIKNNYKAGKTSEAKAILQGILDYIEPYKDTDKVILSEAYGLLKYNLEYVRDELLK